MPNPNGETVHDEYGYTGSILTPSQRKFLRNGPDEEQSADSQRMTRRRIRKRLGAAVVDFSRILTSAYFDIEDIEMAFTDEVGKRWEPLPTDLIQDALAILFLGSLAGGDDARDGTEGEPYAVEQFAEQLRVGIERAYAKAGREVTDCQTDLRVTTEQDSPPDESTELYRLDADQLDRLHLANYITEAEYVEAMYKRHQTPPVGEDRLDE